MFKLFVDDIEYSFKKSSNILEACLVSGVNIPYFCWHPMLGSVGSCRQCAVKLYANDTDKKGKIVMSCMTPLDKKTIISVQEKEVINFRKQIIELLMINHPHDCPICEEAGSCHLQDMTVMTEHYSRRYRYKKKTHLNQYLGPFIQHEMNRCIKCFRCVRYYQDYTDGKDLGVFGSADNIYFGRLNEGMLNSEHSGNLVEICPTGVFTDKIYSKNYTRKWDMQYAPSVCQYCSIGCNTIVGERSGKIRKIDNRFNKNVNHYLICDLGRFGFSYSNSNDRPKNLKEKIQGKLLDLNKENVFFRIKNIFKNSSQVIGIGSSRASIESNFSLQELVGKENFSMGVSNDGKELLDFILNLIKNRNFSVPTLSEIENCDVILILGEDLTQISPRMALAVRQAVKRKQYGKIKKINVPLWHNKAVLNISQDKKNKLFITSIDHTKLDDISSWNYYASYEKQAEFSFLLAKKIKDFSFSTKKLDHIFEKKISLIASSLLNAKNPLIISGSHSRSISLIKSASNIVQAIKKHNKNVNLVLLTPNANSLGVACLEGMSIETALEKVVTKKNSSLIILENDLYRYISKSKVNKVLKFVKNIITIDHISTLTTEKSTMIIPCTNFFESSGTVVNYEGRAQRFFKVYDPNFYNKNVYVLESWKWLTLFRNFILDKTKKNISFDDIVNQCGEKHPKLKKIVSISPNSNFRIFGQKIARSPHRYTGRTALFLDKNVHEFQRLKDNDTMFSFSMEGNQSFNQTASYVPFIWFPGWNSAQAWNKVQIDKENKLCEGLRLFSKNTKNRIPFFKSNKSVNYLNVNLKIVPYYSIYGSEEITQKDSIILKLIKSTYIKINKLTAIKLGFKENSFITFFYFKEKFIFKVKFSVFLDKNIISLPIGFPNIPFSLIEKNIKNLKIEKQCILLNE
ncbi:NADH-quinone oxidoreductase subunit NuoG [Buchnera aphidicola (Mindarus keteleerifoliae)]|uniref:NADH-quinone oxidoreductase subunit NuoG n=1 Tax=Buchnera aphidicola TaxID=9 RepID=UPI0031B6BCE3